MRSPVSVLRAATLLLFALVSVSSARAQASPTATQGLQLSVFAGATGTETGLLQGRNLGITAGVDLGFGRFFGLHPAAEIRGTYPIDSGDIVGEQNVLGGLRLDKAYGRFRPYGDFLYGRGELNYQGIGVLNPSGTLFYLQSFSNVMSPGAGVDIDLTPHFAVKADAQFQHYKVPVTTSGTLWSTAVTVGVVYRLDFNRHHHIYYTR